MRRREFGTVTASFAMNFGARNAPWRRDGVSTNAREINEVTWQSAGLPVRRPRRLLVRAF